MDTCDRGWREGEHWQKEKSKNSQEKDPSTLERMSQGEDLCTFENRSHQSEKVEGREEEEEKEKKVKHRIREWWKKYKELIRSLFLMRMKRGTKEKENKTSERRAKAGQTLGNFGK